jgi:hypothetical protein
MKCSTNIDRSSGSLPYDANGSKSGLRRLGGVEDIAKL